MTEVSLIPLILTQHDWLYLMAVTSDDVLY